MTKQLIFLFIIPLFTLAQTAKIQTKTDLSQIYIQAITDFVKAAHKKNKSNFDTLFFGKHINGEPSDFPNINLPKTIENVQIRVVTTMVGAAKQKQTKSNVYINLMGWLDKENAEFIFVVFSNGFVHQYDYFINYKYSSTLKKFELEKLEFKTPHLAK